MSDIKSLVVERGRADIHVTNSGSTFIGPDGVKLYRLLTIKHGMEIEFRGFRLTRKAPSCFTIVRREFGLKGNKRKLYEQFCNMHGFEAKPAP